MRLKHRTARDPTPADFWHSAWVDVSIYKRFGMATPPWEGDASHRMAESGQVLLDRVRHFDVLQWLWLLNSHTEVVYKAVHGDKVGCCLQDHKPLLCSKSLLCVSCCPKDRGPALASCKPVGRSRLDRRRRTPTSSRSSRPGSCHLTSRSLSTHGK